jgi:hypothetical protein
MAIEEAQLGILRDVFDFRVVGVGVLRRQDPADVAPPHAVLDYRVRVARLIREAVVMAMMRRPPQDSLLHARHRQHREHELKRSARLVGAV